MIDIIGITGAAFILIAWIFGLMDELKKRKNLIDFRFSVLSLVGTIILFYYSYSIGNIVFQFLNVGIFFVILFEIVYTIYINKYI